MILDSSGRFVLYFSFFYYLEFLWMGMKMKKKMKEEDEEKHKRLGLEGSSWITIDWHDPTISFLEKRSKA